MKIDYLHEGSDDCPLVRLYQFQSAEIQRLRGSFESLVSGMTDRIVLGDVESVDGTHLTFTRGASDQGVMQTGPHSFDVVLTSDGWQDCIALLEPFCQPAYGHHWLCDVGRIRLLVSSDGSW